MPYDVDDTVHWTAEDLDGNVNGSYEKNDVTFYDVEFPDGRIVGLTDDDLEPA